MGERRRAGSLASSRAVWATSACWRRSPRCRATASSAEAQRDGGVGERGAADRRRPDHLPAARRRAHVRAARAARASGSSTSARARATTPRCLPELGGEVLSVEREPALAGRAGRSLEAPASRTCELFVGDGALGLPERGAVRRHQRRRGRARDPAALRGPARARAGGSWPRSASATSASCWCAARPRGCSRAPARPRALRAPRVIHTR